MGFFDFLFGARGEAKKNNRLIDEERSRVNQESGRLSGETAARLDPVTRRDDAAYNMAMSGYQNLLGDEYGSAAGGAGLGGLNWGDSEAPQLNADRDWFRNYARNPIDANAQARIRGNGVFDEYARTGGWDEGRKADFRARANSVVPSFYGNLRNELQRQAAVTGNQSGGMLTSSLGRAARQQAMAGQDAVREGELGLAGAIDQGRQWGAGNVSSSEQGLQGLLGQLRLASMGQSANIGQGLMNSADNRAQAQGSLRLQDRGLDLQGQGLDLQRRLGALQGIRGLRTDTPGEAADLRNNQLQLFGGTNAANQGNIGMRVQNNPNRSLFDNIMQIGGMVAPVVGAFGGGPSRSTSSAQASPFSMAGWNSAYAGAV